MARELPRGSKRAADLPQRDKYMMKLELKQILKPKYIQPDRKAPAFKRLITSQVVGRAGRLSVARGKAGKMH
jgi:hypothetical protein